MTSAGFIDGILKLPATHPLDILELVKKALIDEKSKDFAECVKWACFFWEDQHANQIKQLLFNFPPTQGTSSGHSPSGPVPKDGLNHWYLM